MATSPQGIYNKTFKLRAGETVKILLGESIPVDKTHLTLRLKSVPPKTVILVALVEGKPGTSITKHVRVDAGTADFDFNSYENRQLPILETFNRLDVSVPEDTDFNLRVHVTG